ncbi:hypothetical protein LTR36_004474 [Oleoguttula mirabilis]|uniref:BZIP domain-containing protein n=1 Tax=Oleoguttula mirabilis TaxID=1507867 RepID=A0AAV9JGP5_9PEZI|nr:hypothetical protein LTR36_004474 [Oleoguttula mirabilis]
MNLDAARTDEARRVANARTRAELQALFNSAHIPEPVLRSMQEGGPFLPSTYARPEEVHPRRPDIGGSHDLDGRFAQGAARVPLPPQNLNPIAQAPLPSGPMSSNVVIPPRPRPGRKPIPQEDAADRRRLQNRIAQRNFRDKRQQKLWETQVELEERKQDYQERINELERQLDDLRREKKTRDKALKAAERRAMEVEKLLQQSLIHGGRTTAGYPPNGLQSTAAATFPPPPAMGAYGASSVPTPPEESYFETDYTNAFQSGQRQTGHPLRPTISNDSVHMDFSRGMDSDDRCGFCTDDQNCACRNESRQNAHEAASGATAIAPGSCDDCRRDPTRAQACRDLATGASFAPRPSTSEGSRLFDNNNGNGNGNGNGLAMSMAPPRISCSAMVESFRQYGERTSSISELLGGQMRAFPLATGGYEIEEHEAAQVLQSLSRRNTMVAEPLGRMSVEDASR